MNYFQYLQSDHWRKMRYRRLLIDGFQCHECGHGDALQVHHKTYERIGKENVDTDLVTLCARCHNDEHRRQIEEKRPVLSRREILRSVVVTEEDFIRVKDEFRYRKK